MIPCGLDWGDLALLSGVARLPGGLVQACPYG